MPKTVFSTGDVPTATQFNAFTQEENAAVTGGTIGGVTSVGVGVATASVTAKVHIAAGSTAAGTAPLKLTAGPLLTTVEPGALEYKGHTGYFTTYLVRRSIVLAQEIPIAQVQVPASSTSKTLVYQVPMAATYLTAGKKINMRLNGTITQRNSPNSFYTITLEYAGGGTVLTFTTPVSTAMAALPFEIDLRSVCRSIGVTGSMISFGKFTTSGSAATSVMGAVTTIDTTQNDTLSVYVQANENNSGTGPVNVEMAETICVDANT